MHIRTAATLAALLTLPATAAAQDGPTACAGPESHKFDFWAGTWEVESRTRTPDGEWTATGGTWTAETVLGGCAFVDFAEGDFGNGPMKGMGSRYYDPRSETWYITWLSTSAPGQLGVWEGGFDDDGTATFLREVPTPNGTVLSRIRWWDMSRERAEWEHAVSRDGGDSWQPTWRMTFRRAGEQMGAGMEAAGNAAPMAGHEGGAFDALADDDLARRLEALYYAGELTRGIETADSALAALGDDDNARVRLLTAKGKLEATRSFTNSTPLDGALATLREAAELSQGMETAERADAILELGFAEYVQAFLTGGEFAPIRARFERSLEIARDLDDPRRTARALFHVGLIHERLMELDDAVARYREALAIADASGARLVQSYAHRHIGFAEVAREDFDASLRHLRRSLELREAIGFRVYLPYSNATLAEVLAVMGRPDDAVPYATRAVALADDLGAPRTRAVAGLVLARVHLARGETDTAREVFRQVLDTATEIGYQSGIDAARQGLEQTGGR